MRSLPENPRCAGCGTRNHPADALCPRQPPPLPSAYDEATETADDVSLGAAYGDAALPLPTWGELCADQNEGDEYGYPWEGDDDE